MKLLYLWMENHRDMIKNQSFNISSSYHIDFDIELNRLYISQNKDYIEHFYGNNILDLAAIVGRNGVGKTTITRCLYDICDSVHPCDEDIQYATNDKKRILVYENESQQEGEPRRLIIHYFLSSNLEIDNPEGIMYHPINLKDIEGEELSQAEQQHDMTMVYFTNAFEINNVLDNQSLSELSVWGTHKSLCYTPILSLHRAFVKLREHYGAKQSEGGLIISAVEQYAKNMTTDFKLSYATANSYNYLISTRYFPGTIARILPVMKDFKLGITEFGQYIKYEERLIDLGKFDLKVLFVRKNIYEHITGNFKRYHWEQLYVNVVCEITLFLSLAWKINFEKLKNDNLSINNEKLIVRILAQIPDDEENTPKKELIKKIRNVQTVDLSIIKEFIEIVNRYEEFENLATSTWYKQIKNFSEDYNNIKNIAIDQKINFGFSSLIELIIEQYNNKETVYGRMLNIIPQAMSSGEVAMINIFATVYSAVKKKTSGTILLIIDEIDAFLHPEWQQDILTHITSWINESELFNNKKVQLVVATHSPIILSDIPGDKIIYLKDAFEACSSKQLTFGANISTLFYNSFFMEQGSIGAIARKEIQWAINSIENKKLSLTDQRKLVYIINNIGDKFLREKLKSYPVYIDAVEGRNGL